jgi:Na+-transporting NADH:ubiquinone oxidoreductase subunit NqrD
MKMAKQNSHPFWGNNAPLSTLFNAALMIIATARLSFAITAAGALIWVYGIGALVAGFAKPILPEKGRDIVWVFLSSFLGSLYLLLFYFISPYLAMETLFIVTLVPLSFIGSGVCGRIASLEPEEALSKSLAEALVLGGILIALSLIREPWGFGSLSLPGGKEGIVELFRLGDDLFFPISIFASSSGGLLILGYGLTLFRRFKKQYGGEDDT